MTILDASGHPMETRSAVAGHTRMASRVLYDAEIISAPPPDTRAARRTEAVKQRATSQPKYLSAKFTLAEGETWGSVGTYYEPPVDPEDLLDDIATFGIVRAAIEVTVNRVVGNLVLKPLISNPSREQGEIARYFYENAGGELRLEDLLWRWLYDALGIGWGLLEPLRDAYGWPVPLNHVSPIDFRRLKNLDWVQILSSTTEQVHDEKTGKTQSKTTVDATYFQNYGRKWHIADDGSPVWDLVDLRGNPLGSFTMPRLVEESANEVLMLSGYTIDSPYYGVAQHYGARWYLIKVLEKIVDDIANRLDRPFAANIVLVDGTDTLDEEGTEDKNTKTIRMFMQNIAHQGTRDNIVVTINPYPYKDGGKADGVRVIKMESELPSGTHELLQEVDRRVARATGTPQHVLGYAQKTGNLNAESGRYYVQEWYRNKVIPLRRRIENKLRMLLRDMGVKDWGLFFEPFEDTAADRLEDARRDHIYIGDSVLSSDEVRKERGYQDAETGEAKPKGEKAEVKAKETETQPKGGSKEAGGLKETPPGKGEAKEAQPSQEPQETETRAAADEPELGADEWRKLYEDLDADRGDFAEKLILLLVLLPRGVKAPAEFDRAVARVADKIVSAGEREIMQSLRRHQHKLEQAFGVKLSAEDLEQIAADAKARWAEVVQERWLGTHLSAEELGRQARARGITVEALAKELEGKSMTKRILAAGGALAVGEAMQESMKLVAKSAAREATERPIQDLFKKAAVVGAAAAVAQGLKPGLVDWRVRSLNPCQDCMDLEAQNPWDPRRLPTRPGAGDTACRHNCRCVIVPHGTPVDVESEEVFDARMAEQKETNKERAKKRREEAKVARKDEGGGRKDEKKRGSYDQ